MLWNRWQCVPYRCTQTEKYNGDKCKKVYWNNHTKKKTMWKIIHENWKKVRIKNWRMKEFYGHSPSDEHCFQLNILFHLNSGPKIIVSIIIMYNMNVTIIFLFFKDFTYLFLERGERREKQRKRNIHVWWPLMLPLLGTWPATQACALTGNQTDDPLVHRPELNPLSHTTRAWMSKSFLRESAKCS